MSVPLTPLIPYFEGIASTGVFFTWAAPTNIDITRYRLEARTAPTGSSLTVAIKKNGTTQDTITLIAGSTDTGHENVSISFDQGDILTLDITAVGSTVEGSGLQFILDVEATDLTVVPQSQTPYLIELEGNLVAETIYTYTFARTVQLRTAQFTVKTAPTGSSAIVLVKHTNNSGTTTVATLTVAASTLDSGQTVLSETYYPGDILTVVVSQIGSTITGAGLSVLMDYNLLDLVTELVGQYYSEPDSEVIQFLKQIGIGAGRADTVTTAQLVPYKQRANDIIDTRLAAVYRTPLKTITRNLVTSYPTPIAQIAQRIVAYLMVNDIFSEIEPNASSNAERNYKMAIEDLESVASRRTLLKGQRFRSRSYGSNPYTEPLLPFSSSPEPGA